MYSTTNEVRVKAWLLAGRDVRPTVTPAQHAVNLRLRRLMQASRAAKPKAV